MMNCLISVVIPVFNAENFVLRQLEIIDNQSIQNIEVIFVDNNSTDNSKIVIKREIEKGIWPFPIRLLTESKQGAGAARNKGLGAAVGDYIAFLDIDDEILPGKWHKDLELFELFPEVDFVFCRTKRIYEDGKEILHDANGIKEGLNEPPLLGKVWTNHFFKIQNTSSALIKKQAAIDIGGFEESVLIGEDAMFFIKLGYFKQGYFYDEVYFYYFKRSTSTTVARNKVRSPNLDNFILKKNCIIPFYESVGEATFVQAIRFEQLFLLRQLLIEGLYSWPKINFELKELGFPIPLLYHLDIFLIRTLRLNMPVRFNPILRMLMFMNRKQ